MKKLIKMQKDFKHASLWEKIIDQWIDNNLVYIEQMDAKDCIYWHNERANVGALLGAIWQVGGVGTIEYEASKDDNGKLKEGQIDLYFKLDGYEYLAEAKFLRDEKINEANIKSKLKKALENVLSSSKRNNVQNTISLVFIVPVCEQKNVELICEKFYQSKQLDILVEVQVDRELKYNENSYNTFYLLGKDCKRIGDIEEVKC